LSSLAGPKILARYHLITFDVSVTRSNTFSS
jgi:hypothetical protein